YLVEQHSLRLHAAARDLVLDVPGDGLAFAIGVGGEQHAIGVLRRRLQLGDHLLLALDDLVDRLEAVLDVHAHLGLRQVHDVAHRGLHRVAGPQVFLDRLRLRGGLDHDQRVAEGLRVRRGALRLPAIRFPCGLLRYRLSACHGLTGAALDAGTPVSVHDQPRLRTKYFPGLWWMSPFSSSSVNQRSASLQRSCAWLASTSTWTGRVPSRSSQTLSAGPSSASWTGTGAVGRTKWCLAVGMASVRAAS